MENGSTSLNLTRIHWGSDQIASVCDLSSEIIHPCILLFCVGVFFRCFTILLIPAEKSLTESFVGVTLWYPRNTYNRLGKQVRVLDIFSLLKLAGRHRLQTTAHHPASNGMVERWHRTLKAAFKCYTGQQWINVLSTVFLALKSNVLDSGSSPAEYM